MNPADLLPRDPRSRLFGIPAPPRPFEPLALGGALVCLIAHFAAIPGLNELAGQGGILEGDLPSWYHTTTDLLLLSFAVNLLALLRIWWCGHERQGVMLAFFAIVTSAWMLLLLGFFRGTCLASMAKVSNLEGFHVSLTHPIFLLCAIGYGTLLYCGYDLVTRSRRTTQGPKLAVGLVLLLGVVVAGASWTALTVRSVLVRATLAEYQPVLPESTTADPYVSPLSDGWVQGAILGLDAEEAVICSDLWLYAMAGGWKRAHELHDLFEDWPPSLKDRHDWLLEIDSGSVEPLPSTQHWLDNSLFLAPTPDHHFEDLTGLLNVSRESFPERSIAGLLACRRYDRSQGIQSMLTGEEVPALHCIPLETQPIPDAPTVRVSFRDSRIVLGLNGEPTTGDADLTARLASALPEGVNFECHPRVHVSYVVRVLDVIRSAGVIRVAIPPVSDQSE